MIEQLTFITWYTLRVLWKGTLKSLIVSRVAVVALALR